MIAVTAGIWLQSLSADDMAWCAASGQSTTASGQNAGREMEFVVDPTESGEGYTAVLYDNTNGLPTSEANAIVETAEGFLWIGSYSGLIRYDGNTFERVDSTTGIASVVNLFVDSQDRLWVGTNDSGVAVLEQGEFHMYGRHEGLPSLTIRQIVEDGDGNIYVATTQGIAVIDTDMNLHLLDDPQLNESYIVELKVCDGNVLYGITREGEVFCIQNQSLTGFYNSDDLGFKDAYSLFPVPDHSGSVYIGTKESEIYYGRFENGFIQQSKIDVSPLEYLNSIESIEGKLWICADNGIGMITDNGFVKLSNIPLTSSIETMGTDYQGNLWFTSSKQGVMKIVPSRFTDVFEQYGFSPSVVNTTCMYQGRLFVGGKDDGLCVLNGKSREISLPLTECITASGKDLEQTDLIQMLEGHRIRSILTDSQDRLWISTYGDYALIRYKDGKVVCFTPDDGLPSDRIRAICERTDGKIMVACTGGLVVLDDNGVAELYNASDGINNTEILTVLEGMNQDMLIGTDGDGIYVVSASGSRHLGIDDGLSSEVVMRIKKDNKRDIFWIVTSNSIAYMDADYRITTVREFPYSNNFDMYENSKGDMWILSSNGIYVVPVTELLENGEINPVYYNRDNGLCCITTANSYSTLTTDGDLYIAGTTGVAKVNIEQPFENVQNVKMVVPYVQADGDFLYPDKDGQFTIDSSVKKLTIYSFVYNYSLINPQITYYLEGFEKGKTTISRSDLVPVDYTNLKGGSYHFVMELKDPAGGDKQEISVAIVKQKAFYEQVWFYILSLLLGAFLIEECVRFYIRLKTRGYEKKAQEQRTLIREITEAFAKTIDMKDKYTNGHSSRVADYTVMLARELGYDEETVEKYYNIALLHDIGKIGVPAEVLNKPGKLTDEEFQIIKSHSTLGYNVLKDISIMPELAIGAGAHHERPDGKGYPRGLAGEEIPRVAQIIAVADTFDAMYSNRPYRKRMNFEKVVSVIKDASGTQLTSDVVDAFLRLVEKGEMRAPDDHGGGSMEDINNIHKKYDEEK